MPRTYAALAAGVLVASLAACGDDPSPSGDPAGDRSDSRSDTPAGASSSTPAGTGLPRSDEPVALDPAAFTTEITNRYWPMEPGTRWTYREVDEDGEELRVTVTVSSATRRIANGVTARVVRDTVTTADGELLEDTFDWYAQDADGTVWYLGEDTAEFEDGEVASRDGSFEAGVDGALAGVAVPGTPEVGLAYRQEYYEDEAEDRAVVLSISARVTAPAGTWDGALQTEDTNPLEPEVLEHKFYAPGVGMVLALDKAGGGREELLSVTRVSAAEAARAGRTPLGTAY